MDKVQHFEIPAEDKERAKKFYSSVFGWEFSDVPDLDYSMIKAAETDDKGMVSEKGAISGGLMQRMQIKNPVITIVVQNIDETLKKVRESGGEVFKGKADVPKMGVSAYIKDSEGNIMGLWQDIKR
jgi:predicted enzyme related to lactoylglutathione lyase